MNETLDKFVKRSNSALRKAKISLKHTGNADIDTMMNRVAEQAERVKKLASRGSDFEEARTTALEAIWDDLLELQELSMSMNTVWSDLPPGDILPIDEAILSEVGGPS